MASLDDEPTGPGGRVLLLEGVYNFRDFGGYAVSGGGRLKRGVLWRSGQHHGATDADLDRIAALGLTVVYDLRSERERGTYPCRRSTDFSGRVHHSADPAVRAAPHLAAAGTARLRNAVSTREALRNNYRHIPFRPELNAMIVRMLEDLAAGEEAILVNCMAGKDRTGIAVAAVHLAIGVHRDDVIADYLLTNTAGDAEARIRVGGETIKAITGTLDEDVLRVLMGVEAEYLETAFAAMRERHGSEAGWLDAIGANAALREKLRDRVVAA